MLAHATSLINGTQGGFANLPRRLIPRNGGWQVWKWRQAGHGRSFQEPDSDRSNPKLNGLSRRARIVGSYLQLGWSAPMLPMIAPRFLPPIGRCQDRVRFFPESARNRGPSRARRAPTHSSIEVRRNGLSDPVIRDEAACLFEGRKKVYNSAEHSECPERSAGGLGSAGCRFQRGGVGDSNVDGDRFRLPSFFPRYFRLV